MDAADHGNDRAQQMIDQHLASRVRYTGTSREHCIDCDEPIPHGRREAIQGCTRCAPCQTEEDRWQARR